MQNKKYNPTSKTEFYSASTLKETKHEPDLDPESSKETELPTVEPEVTRIEPEPVRQRPELTREVNQQKKKKNSNSYNTI